jgi:hypothetical protein
MKNLTILGLATVITCISIYGGWKLSRWLNYGWSYRDQVISTIKNTVKKECLK